MLSLDLMDAGSFEDIASSSENHDELAGIVKGENVYAWTRL